MQRYQRIKGDKVIVDFMLTVMDRAAKDQVEGSIFVSMETLADVGTLHPEFAAQVKMVADLVKQRRAAVVETNDQEEMVKLWLRAAWKEVKVRVKGGRDSEALYAHYKMTTEGKPQPSSKRRDWINLATEVVAGIEDAHAAGFEPVVVYDALRNALYEAQPVVAHLSDIKERVHIQRNRLDDMRPQARQLCKRVVRDLRYFLADETPSRQREIMREYGVEFSTDSNEKKADTGQSSQANAESMQPASDTSTSNFGTVDSSMDAVPDNATGVTKLAFSSATNGNGVTHHEI